MLSLAAACLAFLLPIQALAGPTVTSTNTNVVASVTAGEDEIPLADAEILVHQGYPAKILIARRAACMGLLKPILEPEALIVEGIEALQHNPGSAVASGCFDAIVKDWQTLVPEPPPPSDDPEFAEAMQRLSIRLDQVNRDLACTAPESAPTCDGKLTGPAQVAAKKAEQAAILAEYDQLQKQKSIDDDLPFMANAFVARPDGTLSEAGYDLAYRLREVLSDREAAPAYFDRAAALRFNTELKCAAGTDAQGNATLKAICAKKKYPLGADQAAVMAKLRALFPNPSVTVAKYEADTGKRMKAKLEKMRARASVAESTYGLRRLLAVHQAYEKKYPQASLEAFCAANEVTQRKDRDFALKTGKVRPFVHTTDWKWATEFGISEAEVAAVRAYTGSFYKTINPSIWKAKASSGPVPLNEKDISFADTLNRALDRVPPFRAKPVRRFSSLPPAQLAAHAVGSIVTYDAFTSTSKKEEWQWSNAGPKAHSFLIYGGKNGVDINDISDNNGEEEVLFKTGTRFKVLSRKPMPTDGERFEFVMAEVDEAGNVIADLPVSGANAKE